jgi:hypothetical protein
MSAAFLAQAAVSLDRQDAGREQVGNMLRPVAAVIAGHPLVGLLPERVVFGDPFSLPLPGSGLLILAFPGETAFHQRQGGAQGNPRGKIGGRQNEA